MGAFDEMLREGESLFKNESAIELDFVPKMMPFRDAQQKQVASAIRPLLQGRNGTNVFVHGAPGIGKTAAIKWIFRELEEQEDVNVVYVNCWQRNTSYQVFVEVCDQLGYKFTQNKRQDELMAIIANICNKKPTVFCFDEIDKVGDLDFLYSILQDIYKRSVVLITNYKEWIADVEERIKSRLMPDIVEFKAYNRDEMSKIIRDRVPLAFVPGAWHAEALEVVLDSASKVGDLRAGWFLMRQAAITAENEASRKIMPQHAAIAIEKLALMTVKKPEDLEDDTRVVLEVIKEAGGGKSGELFKRYKEKGGEGTYKTFSRKVEKLARAGMIKTNKVLGGAEGSTTHISMAGGKSLEDY